MDITTLKSFVRDLFFENSYYKLFSLVLVATLYVWVLGDRDAELSVFVPLRVGVPEGMVLVNQPSDRVQVTLAGRWNSLQRFSQGDDIPTILVELEPTIGEEVVPITPDMVQTPAGLTVRSVQPSFLDVELRERDTKTVPIRVRTVGKLPDGYKLGQISFTPRKVEVSGPRQEVARTEFVATEPVDVTNRTDTFTEDVRLRYESPMLRDALEGPVRVTVPIRTIEIEKTFEDIEVTAVNTTMRAEIVPSTVSVTLRGPREVIERFTPKQLLATLNMDSAEKQGAGVYQRNPNISNIPPGLTLVRSYPTDFKVTLNPADE